MQSATILGRGKRSPFHDMPSIPIVFATAKWLLFFFFSFIFNLSSFRCKSRPARLRLCSKQLTVRSAQPWRENVGLGLLHTPHHTKRQETSSSLNARVSQGHLRPGIWPPREPQLEDSCFTPFTSSSSCNTPGIIRQIQTMAHKSVRKSQLIAFNNVAAGQ